MVSKMYGAVIAASIAAALFPIIAWIVRSVAVRTRKELTIRVSRDGTEERITMNPRDQESVRRFLDAVEEDSRMHDLVSHG